MTYATDFSSKHRPFVQGRKAYWNERIGGKVRAWRQFLIPLPEGEMQPFEPEEISRTELPSEALRDEYDMLARGDLPSVVPATA